MGRRPGTGPSRPGMGGGDILGGPGGMGLLEEDPKQYRFDYVRRKIRAQLHSVQFGLTAAEDKTRGARVPPRTPPIRSLWTM